MKKLHKKLPFKKVASAGKFGDPASAPCGGDSAGRREHLPPFPDRRDSVPFQHPYSFLVNALIVGCSYSLALLFRKQKSLLVLFTLFWLTLGIIKV